MAVELQTALFIVGGTLALFTFYFDGDTHEYLTVLGIALVLTEARDPRLAVAGLGPDPPDLRLDRRRARRAVDRARLVGGDRRCRSCCCKRDLPIPVLVSVLPTCIVGILILDLPALAIFPLLAGAAVAMGYSAILHYLAVEAGMRPVLLDINSSLAPRLRTGFWAVSLRTRLLVALPLINLITGLVVAALTSERRRQLQPRPRRARRAARVDHDLARAHGAAVEVDPATAARPLAGGRADRRAVTTTSRFR